MSTSKLETFFDWSANFLGLAGGIPAIAEKIGKVWGHIPEPIQEQLKQRMPGFLGLSLEDERLFNSILGKLDVPKQRLIARFLHDKCKNFQRNRFINIVAGMQVVAGTPIIVERKWNRDTKKFEDKKTAGKDTEDLRLNFLQKFAEFIEKYGISKAYEYCVGGRMVLENPFHQKAIVAWKESVDWFQKLLPASGELWKTIQEKTSAAGEQAIVEINATTKWLRDNTGGEYQGFWRAAFPTRKSAIASGVFVGAVILMLICGIIWS